MLKCDKFHELFLVVLNRRLIPGVYMFFGFARSHIDVVRCVCFFRVRMICYDTQLVNDRVHVYVCVA